MSDAILQIIGGCKRTTYPANDPRKTVNEFFVGAVSYVSWTLIADPEQDTI